MAFNVLLTASPPPPPPANNNNNNTTNDLLQLHSFKIKALGSGAVLTWGPPGGHTPSGVWRVTGSAAQHGSASAPGSLAPRFTHTHARGHMIYTTFVLVTGVIEQRIVLSFLVRFSVTQLFLRFRLFACSLVFLLRISNLCSKKRF